ncbi:hypothetical protein [Nonomuraea sp. NPDC003804]|uniref:hypothetical protein n=1 Tax=Nonomuraea sp. NPDC003804 TaxID=3154547 RepID=UPI0033BF1B7C
MFSQRLALATVLVLAMAAGVGGWLGSASARQPALPALPAPAAAPRAVVTVTASPHAQARSTASPAPTPSVTPAARKPEPRTKEESMRARQRLLLQTASRRELTKGFCAAFTGLRRDYCWELLLRR